MDERVARHHTSPDPGADREVTERVEADCRAPTLLAERRGVYVGVEGDRHPERATKRAGDVGVRPAGLGRRRDPTALQVDRPERANPDRLDLVRGEELDCG